MPDAETSVDITYIPEFWYIHI